MFRSGRGGGGDFSCTSAFGANIHTPTLTYIIAKHISARLRMRDLFSGCAYVRTYVHAYVRTCQ